MIQKALQVNFLGYESLKVKGTEIWRIGWMFPKFMWAHWFGLYLMDINSNAWSFSQYMFRIYICLTILRFHQIAPDKAKKVSTTKIPIFVSATPKFEKVTAKVSSEGKIRNSQSIIRRGIRSTGVLTSRETLDNMSRVVVESNYRVWSWERALEFDTLIHPF